MFSHTGLRRGVPFVPLAVVFLAMGSLALRARAGDDWLPVTPEELQMKDNPASPGAHAIYLYRESERNDIEGYERIYRRIKILTEEGRNYGNVEIRFLRDNSQIHNIRARTIRPDGSIVNFDGKVFEKTVVKGRGVRYLAKIFSLPGVEVGSIIEYRYTMDWDREFIYSSHWVIPEELFTRRAKFSLRPSKEFPLRWSWRLMPHQEQVSDGKDGVIRLELQNIPGFESEDYMPPENELKARVDFFYSEQQAEMDPDKFWKGVGKKLHGQVEKFTGKRKAMEQAAAATVSADDPPETKLRKLYARAQQIRNTSFERGKTEKEAKREKLKEIDNVEDVLKRGFANGQQITWLFLALARGAGFEAWPVVVSRRNEYFFEPKLLDARQLNDNVVLVKAGTKEYYLDPGTAHVPFGLLPWAESGVQGRQLDKDGGTFIWTPLPESTQSRIERKARLKMDEEGTVEGQLNVTYTGLEALRRRLEVRNDDQIARKTLLEDEVKSWIPAGIRVELKNMPAWEASDDSLTAEFKLTVPGWAAVTGRRVLLPVALFSNTERHVFEHANRTYPIYFDFAFAKRDDVTIELPPGLQLSGAPKPQKMDLKFCVYEVSAESQGSAVHLGRAMSVNGLFLKPDAYPTLRAFFQAVRSNDEQPVVLQASRSAANH